MGFTSLFGKGNSNSKNVAKERLRLVLIHDRTNISPKFLDMLKGDIIKVISDYMVIDEEKLDIQVTRKRNDEEGEIKSSALIANIPIIKMKEGSMD
ncbi:cell division topological specificity factor MinE [Clostridiaceae bacterium M8S5]|nr:cell division topological specificity factor MinE [Clostridiaceae bacterium M8S5]